MALGTQPRLQQPQANNRAHHLGPVFKTIIQEGDDPKMKPLYALTVTVEASCEIRTNSLRGYMPPTLPPDESRGLLSAHDSLLMSLLHLCI